MNWWLVFGGIALLALVQTAVLAWWLWRKGRALVGELGVLATRAEELADLVARIETPDPARERLH